MAQDPNAGIAMVNVAENGGTYPALIVNGVVTVYGTLSKDAVQGSGVLVGPDEILTAAHVLSGKDGGIRDMGTVSVNGQTYGVSNVELLQYSSDVSMTAAQQGQDLALIHLDRPVLGGTVFALGSSFAGGQATAAGYPASAGGSIMQEATDVRQTSNTILTGSHDDGMDLHGQSGGPLYTSGQGFNTVQGVASGADTHTLTIKQLTEDNIATVSGWMSNDHTDPITSLAAAISGDAAGRPRMFGVMNDVAGALEQAYQDTGATSISGAISDDAASLLQGFSPSPMRSLAFLGGLEAAEAGVTGKSNVLSFVNNLFGLGGSQALNNAAFAGANENHLHGLV